MAANSDYTLYYHDCAGRAEFIRIIFEEANVKYNEVNDPAALKENLNEKSLFPGYAPPSIKIGDFQLTSTPVICKYLCKKFGMFPEKEDDVWHADQINTTIHDYIAEGCLVFHGKNFIKSHYEQQEETKPYIQWFINERIDKWLNHFEKCLLKNNEGKGFVVGDKVTYVDFGLLHVLRATESQFAEKWNSMDNIPTLKAFKERMEARPRLSEYFKSDRCRPFEGASRLVFHGKGFVMSYYDQQEETKPYIQWFIKERIDKWLNHFEKCLQKNNGGKGFVVGNKLTYVDLGLLHVLRATESQFAVKWHSMNNIPTLKAFKDRMEARPRLSAYFKSDRCRPFEGNSMM